MINSSNNQRERAKENALNEHYAIISFKIDETIIYANEKFLKLFGYDSTEIIGKHHKIFCDEKFVNSKEYKNFWSDLSTGKVQSEEFKRVKKSGETIFLQASYKPLKDENGEVFEILKFSQDITQRKLDNINYKCQIEAINKSQAVIEFDMKGNILTANENFLKTMGYSLDVIRGKHHKIFCEEEYLNSQEYVDFWKKLNEGKFNSGKFLRYGKDGKKVWIQATYTPILDFDNNPIKVVKFAQDVTQFEKIKKDYLTDFYNREKLIMDINENSVNNLAILDIDGFSSFNDFYGHSVGDKLIKKFSQVLEKFFDENFIKFRIYGDKFAIVNHNLSKNEFIEFVQKVSDEIREINLNLGVKNFDLRITCGLSFENNTKLLNSAEIANKYAKKLSRNFLIYSDDLNIEKEYEENILWTEKIRSALKEDRIIVHYQPIYNNQTKKNEKYESLVRILDTNGDIIPPFKFLDIAKKSKQYIDITKTIINKTFEKFKDNDLEFSINFTVEDIVDEELNKHLISKINEYQNANRLVIELVESERITEYEPVYEFINKVKSYGCKIAIDDFGSGYSNFEYLVKINADYVKIDGSIIKRILEDEYSLEILKSILTFCKKMEIKTIAEFISDEKLLLKTTDLGINYSQGFHIGKPAFEL